MAENLVLLIFLLTPALCVLLLVSLHRNLRKRNRPARGLHILTANTLLLIALVGVLCLGGELYVRLFYDTTDGFAYSKVTRRWSERYWALNDNGVRDNINYPLEIPHGKRRVTFIGDSFTAGHGIKSVEDRFVNIIRREHPGWEAHAVAVPGYDTGAEFRLLQELLQRNYQLDQVILVYCLNDISDIAPRNQELMRQVSSESRNRPWLVRNSYFLDVLSFRLSLWPNAYLRSYSDIVHDAYRGPLWETQKRRLLAFRHAVESNGGHFAVVTFPFFHHLGREYAFAVEHQQLQSFWTESGTPYLDILPLYRNLRTEDLIVNPFDEHPNEFAHAMAASTIGDFVRQQRDHRLASQRR